MKRQRALFFLFCCAVGLGLYGATAGVSRAFGQTATATTTDLLSPAFDSGQCLTVAGTAGTATPPVTLTSCRGTANQQWSYGPGASQWQTSVDPSYCLATVNNTSGAGGRITVIPCTDSRALTLLPNPTLTGSYQLTGTAYVLDAGVYGYVAVAHQNGWSYQFWRWLQPDLDQVNALGCAIAYPLAASATATYDQELACDRVAKLQPPDTMPRPELQQRTYFPGPVGESTPLTRTFAFDLTFKSHSYLRQSWTPANWQSTGLYVPPGRILRVTINDATANDLQSLYLRIGVHTDQLAPTSGNVAEGEFLQTIWHTKWWGGADPYPHALTVDLGRRYLPTSFTYLPRQEGSNGRVGAYRFALSVDGAEWITVTAGTFADDATEKQVPFQAPLPAQLFTTVTGPIAPGATASVPLPLVAAPSAPFGAYSSQGAIVNAWDGRASPLHDQVAANDQAILTVNVGEQPALALVYLPLVVR